MTQPKPENKKVIRKGICLRPDQYWLLGQYIDLNRVGPFSQFIQDALDEKLARLIEQSKEKLAS